MLGSQTDTVNGQRFTMPTVEQWAPASYGQQTTGVPQVSPFMPPFIGGGNGGGSSLGVQEGVGGYGTAGNNVLVAGIAAEHPHNLKVSPTWWAVFALIIGIGLLNGTAWRHVVDEHADGGFKVGPGKAEGSESV